ncbi:hypothetical protein SAY87_027334 [Trapa incisa]|uniref:Cotton fiber protein n=1 Tax=Trapa incisa TaxID=236973 RepID=A0AAN7GN78_9MYRT|nr:hypothetical protein SAY87_027334 [Trapa incisa]
MLSPYSSSSFSSTSSRKPIVRTLFRSELRRIARALASVKSFLVQVFRKSTSRPVHLFVYFTRSKKTNKIYFGSFRLHYNWCSSRYWSVPASVLDGSIPPAPALAPDPATNKGSFRISRSVSMTWEYVDVEGGDDDKTPELCGYLRSLEEKKVGAAHGDGMYDEQPQPWKNEIDQLADLFIAKCHEKFILEKQESDRRFNEMLARSM